MANTVTPADLAGSKLTGNPGMPGYQSPQQIADNRVNAGMGNTTGNASNPGANAFVAAGAATGSSLKGYKIPVWRNAPAVKNTGGAGSSAAADNQYNLAHPTPETQYASADAMAQFGRILMDPHLMSAWQDTALKAGLVTAANINNATALGAAWDTAVKQAISFANVSGGKTLMTPFEAAKLVGENTGASVLATQSLAQEQAKLAANDFTGTKPGVTTTVVDNKSSYSNSDTLRTMLGRNPTPGELAAYQHGINTVAQANPIVTKREDTFAHGQQTAQTDTSTGGFDLAAAQQESASSASPQVALHQQATTYYQALVQALSAAA